MTHLRQKITLGLVGLVGSSFFQFQNAGLIGLLLLLRTHLRDAAGIRLFVPMAQQIEERDQRKNHSADQYINDHLLPDFRGQFPVVNDDDDVPLLCDLPDKHRAF